MKLLIATPYYSGFNIDSEKEMPKTYRLSVARTIKALGADFKIENTLALSCRVDSARNYLINLDWDKLLFVDHDMEWNGTDIKKLLKADKPFIGALYRMKRDEILYAISPQLNNLRGIKEVGRIGFGLVLLDRSVFISMSHAYQNLYAFDSGLQQSVYCLFAPMLKDGLYFGEDYSFCERWRKIGGKIFVHTGVRPTHWGKVAYR